MKTTKKLHEAYECAKAGKKFEISRIDSEGYRYVYSNSIILLQPSWSPEAITADWDYEEIKEPMVIWVNVYPSGAMRPYPTEIAATEGIRNHGTTKKFIEVVK